MEYSEVKKVIGQVCFIEDVTPEYRITAYVDGVKQWEGVYLICPPEKQSERLQSETNSRVLRYDYKAIKKMIPVSKEDQLIWRIENGI